VHQSGSQGLTIHIAGHSTNSAADGFDDAVIYLERCAGQMILHVWSDINQETPTHKIELDGARIECRKPEQVLHTYKGCLHYTGESEHDPLNLVAEFELQASGNGALQQLVLDRYWDPRLDAEGRMPFFQYERINPEGECE
jgi:hypothetical protein